MGERLEECFVARGGTAGGWWFTAFFHVVYVVVECLRVPLLLYHHRQNPLLLLLLLLLISTSTTIADAEMTAFYLTPSHADALCLVETRDTRGRLWPAGRPGNVHSRNLVAGRHRRSMRWSRITVSSNRLDSHRIDCSTRHANFHLGVAPDSSLTRSTLRDSDGNVSNRQREREK